MLRGRTLFTAYPRTGRGEGGRHILLPGHRKMSQSPPVLGRALIVGRWIRFAAVVFLLFLSLSAVKADDRIIYVSPGGNDAWSGALAAANPQRNDGPVATPTHARDLARGSAPGIPPGPGRLRFLSAAATTS